MNKKSIFMLLLFTTLLFPTYLMSELPTWKQLYPSNSPTERYIRNMVYDSFRNEVVLFGGNSNNPTHPEMLTDTWVWNSNTWQRRITTQHPSERIRPTMAFDKERKVVVLFGGYSGYYTGDDNFDDTWIWNGQDWNEVFPIDRPPKRSGCAISFDEYRKEIVLFGGITGGAFNVTTLDDTWLWNGTNWLQKYPANKPPAGMHSLFYNQVKKKCVLLTYYTKDDTTLWEWDGDNWQESGSMEIPSDMIDIVYDRLNNQMFLINYDDYWDYKTIDTWIWDGSNLIKKFPLFRPSCRRPSSMIYIENSGEIMLFGGTDCNDQVYLNDTWIWVDGTTIAGDGDGDGYITYIDYVCLVRFLLEMECPIILELEYYDLNDDGKINIVDFLMMRIMFQNVSQKMSQITNFPINIDRKYTQ